MATKSIAWNTGSGNINVEYGGSKDGTIVVTSDNNNLYESRSQQIKVRTTDGSNIERTITIQQAAKVRIDISTAIVTAANQTYSGSAKTPTPTVTLNGETIPSSGYDVAYSNNTDAGTATINVTGKGDYTGTATGTFTIAKASRTLSFADAYVVLAPSGNTTKTATPSAGSGDGAITYSISSTSYATINSSSGKVTAKTSDGSAIVTATIAEGTNYLSASASYNLYVFATTHSFAYTGSVQSILVPPGSYKLQVWGAQGGSVSGDYTATGAKGGYSEGVLALASSTTLYAFVGGQGSSASTSTSGSIQNGGWNGGGGAPRICSYDSSGTNGISYPRPGGGATDISTVTSDMSYSSYRNNRSAASLNARLIVAGGGAGASARYTNSTTTNTVSGSSTNGYYIGDITGNVLEPLSVYSSQANAFWHTDGIRTHSAFTIKKYRVDAGQKYYFSTRFGANTNIYAVAWYDSSDNMISYESYQGKFDGTITTFTDVEVTAPSGAYYMYLNTQNNQNYYSCKTYVIEVIGIRPQGSSYYNYVRFSVNPGQTYDVVVQPLKRSDTNYQAIALGGSISGGLITNGSYYSWSTPRQGFNGQITIPSGVNYMYITYDYDSSIPTVSYTTTSTSYDTSNGSQVGGGTSGGGTNPGTQSGGGGELGKGANMTATNYRYASGGGGGGYYGGGASYDDSTTNKINKSGGGSGYVGSLTSAQTKAGNTSFPSTSGSNETGHSGNGYARITRIS